MNILQEAFEDAVQSIVSDLEEPIDDEQLEKIVNDAMASSIPEVASGLLNELKDDAPLMLKERRDSSNEFVDRNCSRWSKGFELLEMLIAICSDAGNDFNNHYRPHAADIQDIVFDAVVRMHARACHISEEILCLLKNGYADGAQARWRALHEVVATAHFIHKHGQAAAIRFFDHEIIASYKGMIQCNEFESRLNVDPFPQADIDDCKALYDQALETYGREFKEPYGWASPFLNNRRPSFAHIEADVELDHMRPYYKWASQNIHANVKGITNTLGLCESKEDILLVGQSDSGMGDPAHSTAIALTQITATLLIIEPNIDTLVTSQMLLSISEEVGEAFSQVELETRHNTAINSG